jgi:uncharacterized integral membrane protein
MMKPDPRTRLNPRLVLGVVLGVLVFVFVVENTRETKIRFFVPQVTAPLWIGLMVAALLGAVAGGLIARHMAAPELRRLRDQQDRNERPPTGRPPSSPSG